MSAPDVMGLGEIALRLGVGPRRARRIANRPDFPAPCSRISIGRVWWRPDVEAWISEHPERRPQ